MKITAAALIEELKQVPLDTEISFQMADGCCGHYLDMELSFAEGLAYSGGHTFQIRMEPLPGYTSCIRAGQTKRFVESQNPPKQGE